VVPGDLSLDPIVPERGTECSPKNRGEVVADQGDGECEQRCLGIAKRRPLAIQSIRQRLEQVLDGPSLQVQFCNLECVCILYGHIGQDANLRVTVRGGLVEADNNAPDRDQFPVLSAERQGLLKDLSSTASTVRPEFAQRDDRKVSVLPDAEETITLV